jgi:hypothetical protein
LKKYNLRVIPACPESLRCGGKDSGQAGMTNLVFIMRDFILSYKIKCEGPLAANCRYSGLCQCNHHSVIVLIKKTGRRLCLNCLQCRFNHGCVCFNCCWLYVNCAENPASFQNYFTKWLYQIILAMCYLLFFFRLIYGKNFSCNYNGSDSGAAGFVW